MGVPAGSFSAAIDSGTSLIYLPASLVSKFYSTIPGAREATEMSPGLWTFPCNSNVDIGFEFDGKMFAVSTTLRLYGLFFGQFNSFIPLDVQSGL